MSLLGTPMGGSDAGANGPRTPQQGSIYWYMKYSGGFVNSLVDTIQRADMPNRGRLRQVYPQVVAAMEMPDWNEAPPNFEPRYDTTVAEAL